MRNIKAKRIVVKIGTNVITGRNGMLNSGLLKRLVAQIAGIKSRGRKVIVITSGAIGAGMKELKLSSRPKDVTMQQVCAAVGQNILMSRYHSFFGRHNIKVAQILITYEAFSDKKTFKNFRSSLNKLLKLGVVPIINENDPISIDEIGPSFGDNDNLSALIASKMKADLLVILTDVDGLFNKDPQHKNAVLIKEIHDISRNIEAINGKSSQLGIGGVQTKVKAAKTATKAGAIVVIANGKTGNVLLKVLSNEDIGTIFYPK
ncbi:glutamate 5-kinase [Candidatus Woesearchaeota archaeon]|nr:glutamate 5-kinase [Candidatus Woesearchaeota archaeon]